MKKLERFGVAGIDFTEASTARGYTYTTRDDGFPPTPLVFNDNPFNEDVKKAKNILDIGCGVGRNLPWIMENTEARYIGLDPNESMLKYFWEIQDSKWRDSGRTSLIRDTIELEYLPGSFKLDVVVCTFVFQHIGFRPSESQMNVADITNNIMRFTRPGTVWIMLEHDGEEDWIGRWSIETGIVPDVYIRNYSGIEEMNHRGLHHLIVWKQK